MDIDDVLAKAKEQGNGKLMTLIRDKTIFYLVLLKQDNTYDFEFVK